MAEKEIIFKPTLAQLKADKKRETIIYIILCCVSVLAFVFLGAPAFIPVLLLGFIVIYHKYAQFKKTINYRCIIIKEDFVSQEVPGMHNELKDFPYVAYRSAGIGWGEIYFKMKEKKISLNMNTSLGSINLLGYPDKAKIVDEINRRIEKHKAPAED